MIYFYSVSLAFNHAIPFGMCYMCSMLAVDSWHKAIGACKFVVAYFLDLEKAYDYVNCNNCFRYVL